MVWWDNPVFDIPNVTYAEIHAAEPEYLPELTKEKLARFPWTTEFTTLYVKEDFSDFVLLIKDDGIPYHFNFYIDCQDLYVVPYVGLTWSKIVQNLKIV